jgi:hypothetical protein
MARDFNGTTDEALAGSAVLTATPISFSAWFDSDAAGDDVLVGLTASGSAQRFIVRLSGSSTIVANARDGVGNKDATTSTTFSTGVWNHAGAAFASSTSRAAYLNGGGKGTNATSSTPASIDRTSLAFSAGISAELFFDGKLAEIGIWDVELTDAEFLTLSKGLCPKFVRPANLRLYVPMYGTDSPELDQWKRAASFTLAGTSKAAGHPRIYYPG